MNEIRNRRAAFLDRDGTLICDVGFLGSPDDIEWLPGAMNAVLQLNRVGVLVLVLTNQSGIARGLFAEDTVLEIHRLMQLQLESQVGGKIDRFYFCPHHPTEGNEGLGCDCQCRKPGTGMFRSAIREWGVNASQSMAAGDRLRDLNPAREMGVRHLYLTGTGLPDEEERMPEDIARFVMLEDAVKDFLDAGNNW